MSDTVPYVSDNKTLDENVDFQQQEVSSGGNGIGVGSTSKLVNR